MDHVDRVRALWAQEAPHLDTAPAAVIARLGRLRTYIDQSLEEVLERYGLTRQSWDVLASLRRVGAPFELTPTELCEAMMRTSGAITHTLRDLEHHGLVARVPHPTDARSLLARLTVAGRALVDEIITVHLDNERRILAPLTANEQATLAGLLRTLLLAFERAQTTPTAPVQTTRRRTRHKPGRPRSPRG